jgi:hypothetical protein
LGLDYGALGGGSGRGRAGGDEVDAGGVLELFGEVGEELREQLAAASLGAQQTSERHEI